ncbi:hypothetical protein [Cesiribacter andamanensis]|uniref:Putative membrane protein n=1 Tax=Cesiribacter andamanensis AMV16 TaxID=1279009 RepID=M7N3I4_9BACT|nr:hypothetical protein [Cesiribacter andamanensis]EMR01852.1 putative membrane protein [Cesiribacter andamanensis AMV16]
MGLIWLFFWGIGMLLFYRKSLKVFLALLFPLLLTLLATLLDLYPFMERMLVFLAPIPILFIAKGCQHCTHLIPARFSARYVLPALLLLWPVWGSANQLAKPHHLGSYKNSNYREALLHINEHYREGDIVYVYWNIAHAYAYYRHAYQLGYTAVELGDIKNQVNSRHEYLTYLQPHLEKARNKKRIWFIHERFLTLNIGDFDDQPPWYHEMGTKAGAAPLGALAAMGSESVAYLGSNVRVILVEVQDQPQTSIPPTRSQTGPRQ